MDTLASGRPGIQYGVKAPSNSCFNGAVRCQRTSMEPARRRTWLDGAVVGKRFRGWTPDQCARPGRFSHQWAALNATFR